MKQEEWEMEAFSKVRPGSRITPVAIGTDRPNVGRGLSWNQRPKY
jgi:hypothetical protein